MSSLDADWGVYVHIPWCKRRCPYCAFYVERDEDTPWTAFVDAVLAEHSRRAWSSEPATVFLGGGTPSRTPPRELDRLLAGLGAAAATEVTAECNPEDLDPAWLDGALAAGLTRISIGVQTFNPDFARLLNRASTVDQARDTVQRVAASGVASWSVDVIFGLPDQTVEDLRVDLRAILETEPPHVALYGLTFEPDTPFGRAKDAGRMTPLPDERWREMYDLLVTELHAAGLHRYEVSNFAKPGHESRHNRLYWTDAPYLGLGPSAHGYLPDGTRYSNVRDVNAYLKLPDPTGVSEPPDAQNHAVDWLLSAMRTREGLDVEALGDRTGFAVDTAEVGLLTAAGLLEPGPALVLSDEGFPVADAVIARLVGALTEV